MSWIEMNLSEVVGLLLGLIFTLSIFSYILGDNMMFRLATHIFIGVAAGFACSVAWQSVIFPQLVRPLLIGTNTERVFVIIPLILSVLLFMKVSRRFSFLGSPVMGFLVGTGAAVAIIGAVTGTLFPQVSATINLFDLQAIVHREENVLSQLFAGGIALIGTLTTFAYFNFGKRTIVDQLPVRFSFQKLIALTGQSFIAVTFGVLFAQILSASIVALIERVNFIWNLILPFISTLS